MVPLCWFRSVTAVVSRLTRRTRRCAQERLATPKWFVWCLSRRRSPMRISFRSFYNFIFSFSNHFSIRRSEPMRFVTAIRLLAVNRYQSLFIFMFHSLLKCSTVLIVQYIVYRCRRSGRITTRRRACGSTTIAGRSTARPSSAPIATSSYARAHRATRMHSRSPPTSALTSSLLLCTVRFLWTLMNSFAFH